ncbi:MAG TPA: cation transporter [Caldithrix sp.]|nr:cation transporter [Caldithrix sp.]
MPHHHHNEISGSRLLITMLLNFVITVAEIIGGILSGSLSLISDALHNFSDGVSIIISYIALKLRYREHSPRHTFGLKRAEIFAAVINSSVLLIISLYLFYEATFRLIHPQFVQGKLMTGVALVGLTANVLGTFLLHRDAGRSLNIKSAYLHLLSDAVSSLGVVLGGLAIYFWQVYWIDPILTILIGLYILKESYKILIRAVHILMEGAPPDIDLKALQKAVEDIPEVQDIHHIHLWAVGEGDFHMEGHVNVNDMKISEGDLLRKKIENILTRCFGIHHITLQFECNQCKQVGLIKK